MIINKKMRDGSFIELKVDEDQGIFLLKHDPERYTLDTKKNPKEFNIKKIKNENLEERILEIMSMGYSREHAEKVLSE